jgi:DNA-binding beta-propeller fold protein YncE
MTTKSLAASLVPAILFSAVSLAAQTSTQTQTIDLPTSKQLIEEVPGHPQRLNSLPVSIAVSPDKRYVVTLNDGYGTFESDYSQSIAVYDTQTGTVADFPDTRTQIRQRVGGKQTLYSGLAFSRDGSHIYASMGSLQDPNAEKPGDTGNGVAVYSFSAGKVTQERFIPLPVEQLAPGRKTRLFEEKEGDKGIPFPAAIAVIGEPGSEKLLVAGNLSDDVLLVDAASGKVEHRFDLSESDAVPGVYPIALAVTHDGKRAFVALWNASEIVELDLVKQTVEHKLALMKPESAIAPGSHPCALELSHDDRTLYVALANSDSVAVVDTSVLVTRGTFDTRLPHQTYFGAEPVSLALNATGTRLYVANMASDAVAVLDTTKIHLSARPNSKFLAPAIAPEGFIPTEWLPFSLTFNGGKLYIATGKGHGTGPNNMPQPVTSTMRARQPQATVANTYIGTLLYGSLAVVNETEIAAHLPHWTAQVIESNRMKAAEQKIEFASGHNPGSPATGPGRGGGNPIKHVIYIIKENRTYDQILGDLAQNGHKVGNGDPSLTMFGADVTPNEHKLALQFGVLDNFYDSGEVSGDGHVWSNAAIGSDYLEKTWQQDYRNAQRTYDFEGVVANNYPILQKIPDVNEPSSGYLWTNLEAHHKTHYNFGEYISTVFCTDPRSEQLPSNPQEGPMLRGSDCAKKSIASGEAIPAEWGGGRNKWPWPIPIIATNTATKPELVGHFAPESPDFDLMVPDQIRAEVILRHLHQWIADRQQGKDTMPAFIEVRLGNDHTAGTRPGGPTPKASVADNDLALGRLVEAVSHSPFWDDTAFFILEDDAQAGADHVEAHRSISLVISKYAPHGPSGGAFIDSHFYTTVSTIRTMELLLGLPPMNNNDAFSSVFAPLFTGPGDQPAYDADYSNRDNNLIYTANKKTAPGAQESMKMDFRHEDRAPTQKLNVILWKDTMGDKPVPAMLLRPVKQTKDDDDN